MTRNIRFTTLLLTTAIAGAVAGASAQTTILPEPFTTMVAGQPLAVPVLPNTDPTAGPITCTGNLYPDSNNIGSPANTTILLGNGCLPTQAILDDVYDVKTDAFNNVYISEVNSTLVETVGGVSKQVQSGVDIRVIYNGGTALYNALIAANPTTVSTTGKPFIPVPGHIYTLAGSLASSISATGSGTTHFYCGGTSAYSTLYGYDGLGDGCPAAQSRITPRGLAIDNDGNVIFANVTTKYGTRVIYVGGTKMFNLIKLLNPTVVTPQVGFIYQLGFNGATGSEGDGGLASLAGGISPRYVAVDSNDNVYMSDGTGATAGVSPSGETVRMINGTTGIITTVAGLSNCNNTTYVAATGCPNGFSGDGGPATSALFNYPFSLLLDTNNNLFIADAVNGRLRVVYRGGTLTGITNPVVGNIYTFAGGSSTGGVQGTLAVDNSPAQQIKFTSVNATGIDKAGNIYIEDGSAHLVWRIDAITGIGNIMGGAGSSTTAPHAGAFCSGTSGPVSVDNFADGCPGILSYSQGQGSIPFDTLGNFYLGSSNSATSSAPSLGVFKFSYNNLFPATAVGSSVNQYVAFTSTVSTALTARSFNLQGSANSEFSDAGGTACAVAGTLAVKATCVVNVKFTPAKPGTRLDQIQFNTSTAVVGTEFLNGTGIAADVAVDNGTVSMIGTGLTPSGIAADENGFVYIADSKAGQLFKGSATGTTATALVTGLKNPSQVAVDNAGNIYIADTGNNRILVTTPAGVTLASLGSGLSGPKGVVVDPYGQIFVADTGNSRIVQLALNGTQDPLVVPGIAIPLSAPTQLALDAAGDLYILDSGNKRIVEDQLSTGITNPIALDPNVNPTALAVDTAGDIYVADVASGSVLDYYAGATPGYGLVVGFIAPVGLAVDTDGNLFTADIGLVGAIELRRSLGNIVFPLTTIGTTSKAAITVDNVGNANLNFTAPLDIVTGTNAAAFSLAPSTNGSCAAGTAYAAGTTCNFIGSFTPTIAGTNTATATFVTNAYNAGTSVALLTGPAATPLTPTSVAVAVVPASGVFYSLPITLNVTLTATPLTTTPTGTFTLTVDGKTIEPPVAVGNGTHTFVVQLAVGTHTLSVTYSGTAPYAGSAATVTVPVQPAVTATSLTVTPQSVNGTGSLLFTSQVTVPTNTAVGQTGTVTIWAGPVGTGTIVTQLPISGATAVPAYSISYTSPLLTYPINSFTAVYSGSANGNFAPSQSATYTPITTDFLVAPVVSAFTVPQGGVGQLNVNVVSLYGSSGNVTASCSGLPVNSVCRFTPNNIALTSNETPVPVLVQIYTNVSSTLASNQQPQSRTREIVLAFGFPLGFGLLLLRRRPRLRMFAVLVFGVSLVAGTSGCSGTASLQTFSTLVTPTGTYNLTLTFTAVPGSGETATHSSPATFTVLPAPTD